MNIKRRKLYKETSALAQKIEEHIQNNLKEYLIISTVFIVGIIIGIIFINKTSQINEITEYIDSVVDSIKTNKNINEIFLLKSSIKKNVIWAILLWLMGSTVIGMLVVYIIIAFRGFSLGYTLSAIIATLKLGKGCLFIFTSMFIQYIIYIPSILALAVSGMKFYNSIINNRQRENIKLEILRHTIFSFFMMLLLILSSFIEVFISTKLLILLIDYI